MVSFPRIFLLFLAFFLSCQLGHARQKLLPKFHEADVTFNDDLLLSTVVPSKSHCALRCSEYETCLAFTLTESNRTCRLHSKMMTSLSSRSTVPRTSAFTLNPECPGNQDRNAWTVFQRRMDGSVDFYRNWTDYANGFGIPHGEYWMGLNALHTLTSTGNWTLRIELGDWEGNKAYATYTGFYVTNSTDKYRLNFDRKSYCGNAGDNLLNNINDPFSTRDFDNDANNVSNCAVTKHGAWWYKSCSGANLNGDYNPTNSTPWPSYVNWYAWKGNLYPLMLTEMKVKLV